MLSFPGIGAALAVLAYKAVNELYPLKGTENGEISLGMIVAGTIVVSVIAGALAAMAFETRRLRS